MRAVGTKSKLQEDKKHLGRWLFDRKRKKNAYISLSGKKYFGADAISASRADKHRNSNPQSSSRPELYRLMNKITTESLLAGCTSTPSFSLQGPSLGTEANEQILADGPSPCGRILSALTTPLALEFWGVPARTCQRYADAQNVRQLFQWQVDCLTCEDGYALNGGNLVYSAPTSG
jgi:hypothetical protein